MMNPTSVAPVPTQPNAQQIKQNGHVPQHSPSQPLPVTTSNTTLPITVNTALSAQSTPGQTLPLATSTSAPISPLASQSTFTATTTTPIPPSTTPQPQQFTSTAPTSSTTTPAPLTTTDATAKTPPTTVIAATPTPTPTMSAPTPTPLSSSAPEQSQSQTPSLPPPQQQPLSYQNESTPSVADPYATSTNNHNNNPPHNVTDTDPMSNNDRADTTLPTTTTTPDSLDDPLIGFSGKDVIKDEWERLVSSGATDEDIRQFFISFRNKHGLNFDLIQDVLILLESAGISRHQFGRVLMNNLTNILKQRIRHMNQTHLAELLDASYSYLTVAELAPIAISTMEHLKLVDPGILSEIVNNGLENSPYIDLPLSLKHKIWIQEPAAFKHEIDLILSQVTELSTPLYHDLEAKPSAELRKERNPALAQLLTLASGCNDRLLSHAAEQIFEKSVSDPSSLRRIAIANIFHDFMIMAPNRSNRTPLGTIRKLARILGASPLKNATTGVVSAAAVTNTRQTTVEDLKAVLNHVSHADTRLYIALLLTSSISRDFLADQIVLVLYDCRGDVGNGENPKLLEQAQNHLRSQPLVVHLTYLLLYNIKGIKVLLENDTVHSHEVDALFQEFLPLLINEIYIDVSSKQSDYSRSVPHLASPKLLLHVTQGKFERRVMSSYCLSLAKNQDMPGLFRQRLILDAIIVTCDPKEEAREAVIATSLFKKMNEL